jgi:hypothetical protein
MWSGLVTNVTGLRDFVTGKMMEEQVSEVPQTSETCVDKGGTRPCKFISTVT